jgi:L-ascorbate metabolism protein UlaG (beta-lactamase superfamily)
VALDQLTLTLIGGPTLVLEWRGFRILTDPTFDNAGSVYEHGPVILRKSADPATTLRAVEPIHAVLLSHDQHEDNLDRAGRALLPTVGRVITTPSGAVRLGGNALGLPTWATTDLGTRDGTLVKVEATPARHGPVGIEPISGDVTGFLVTLGSDGGHARRIYVSGDTVWFEGVAEVARRFPDIGVAILHLGAAKLTARSDAHLTMNTADAVEAAHAFESAIIVPVHYQGWAHLSQGREDFASAFARAGLERRINWLEPGRPAVLETHSGL